MIFNILDNTTELWMTKYIIGEIFSFGSATLYKNPSDQTMENFLKQKLGKSATFFPKIALFLADFREHCASVNLFKC